MNFHRAFIVLGSLAIVLGAGCQDRGSAASRVEAFCSGIHAGEVIASVRARYPRLDLQLGGVAPKADERVEGAVDANDLPTIAGWLVEPAGTPLGARRPVCAIYHSSRVLGGNGKVILAEFKERWKARY